MLTVLLILALFAVTGIFAIPFDPEPTEEVES